jgi:hypothetical protein
MNSSINPKGVLCRKCKSFQVIAFLFPAFI